MERSSSFREFISDYGLSNLARTLQELTGEQFTAQQINHWRTRGVPYRWHDAIIEISNLPKSELR